MSNKTQEKQYNQEVYLKIMGENSKSIVQK